MLRSVKVVSNKASLWDDTKIKWHIIYINIKTVTTNKRTVRLKTVKCKTSTLTWLLNAAKTK